jgi:hypothetical protein
MDIDALAALAANTVVATAVTDAFEGLRAKLARVFGRGQPDQGIQRRLDATRQRLTAAVREDRPSTRAAQVRQWETRFADLLADHPDAAGELRALLAEFRAATPGAGGNVTNTVSGTVSNGPVLMGRDFGDITIGHRDNRPGA